MTSFSLVLPRGVGHQFLLPTGVAYPLAMYVWKQINSFLSFSGGTFLCSFASFPLSLFSYVISLRIAWVLVYKCVLYGKELVILDERDTSKTCSGCGNKQNMPLWKRTYRCTNEQCRLIMDRDENSAVNILKRYLARLGPHTDDSVRCAVVFTAIEDVLNTFEHI